MQMLSVIWFLVKNSRNWNILLDKICIISLHRMYFSSSWKISINYPYLTYIYFILLLSVYIYIYIHKKRKLMIYVTFIVCNYTPSVGSSPFDNRWNDKIFERNNTLICERHGICWFDWCICEYVLQDLLLVV